MRALSASELLAVWECGLKGSPAQQALLLLVWACPEKTDDELAHLGVGQRDRCLLELRDFIFGHEMIGIASCPDCNATTEVSFLSEDIVVKSYTAPEISRLSASGFDVSFRLPKSLDLLSISGCSDVHSARALLLERCILEAYAGGKCCSSKDLPEEVIDAVSERMSELDPQADLRIDLICPDCGCKWQEIFDIVSFFWGEINTWARRTLQDIHMLASTYGWSEADILAMSPWKRQIYLEMVNG